MKTNLVTVFLTCAAIGVFAQGQVQFRTFYPGTTPPVDARVYNEDGITPLDNSNTQWRAALLGGPVTATPANIPGSYPGAAGTFVLGTLSMLYNPVTTTLTWVNFRASPNQGYVSVIGVAREVEGVNWGGTALIQMVAWQGNYTTFADAFNAFMAGDPNVLVGASNPLTLTLPAGPTDPNLTYLVGLRSFQLSCGACPEPSTFALAAVAAAALFMFRRRKSGAEQGEFTNTSNTLIEREDEFFVD